MNLGDLTKFEQLEVKALESLCDQFVNKNNHRVSIAVLCQRLEILEADARRVFLKLVAIDAIEKKEPDTSAPFTAQLSRHYYTISPLICEITDARKEELSQRHAPADRVEAATKWARSHAFLAICIIATLSITLIAALVNQVWELAEKLLAVLQ